MGSECCSARDQTMDRQVSQAAYTNKEIDKATIFELVDDNWIEKGRTEVISNCLNPEFIKSIQIDYYFEKEQCFRAIVSDSDQLDKEFISLASANFIGDVIFKIQTLVCSKKKEIELSLCNKEGKIDINKGNISIAYEEILNYTNQEINLILSPFSGSFKNDCEYFLTIMKQISKNVNDWTSILRTEKLIFNESLAPWKLISIPVDCLLSSKECFENERDIPVQILLSQYNKGGSHSRLISGDTLLELDEPTNNNSFILKIVKCELIRTHSFLDYINNGCELNLIIGIDFTGSNVDTATGQNLHNSDLNQNNYFSAIQKLSKILLNFDTDKNIPLFGFGAMVDESYYNDISHCFALNGNIFRPEVQDITGIEECYKKNMNSILYSGPTYFAPLLRYWNDMVKFESEKNNKRYYTYLMLTDGINHDIDDTIEEIVRSTYLPISIIIIGIGNADFSNMKFLDADDQPLFSGKSQLFSKRDNVQFVEFNKYKNNLEKLAQETLMELPRQIVDYFHSNKINPEDLAIFQQELEARDYFSYQAMQFLGSEEVCKLNSYEMIQSLISEGIAAFDHIDLRRCLGYYHNRLK